MKRTKNEPKTSVDLFSFTPRQWQSINQPKSIKPSRWSDISNELSIPLTLSNRERLNEFSDTAVLRNNRGPECSESGEFVLPFGSSVSSVSSSLGRDRDKWGHSLASWSEDRNYVSVTVDAGKLDRKNEHITYVTIIQKCTLKIHTAKEMMQCKPNWQQQLQKATYYVSYDTFTHVALSVPCWQR